MQGSGLVHIYTGNGKGKTTAAMGLALRALGHDFNIVIYQFLKGRESGEKIVLGEFANIKFIRVGTSKKFFFQMNKREQEDLIKKTRSAFSKLETVVADSKYDMIILDEVMGVLRNNIIEVADVISLINKKASNKELILTGREVPEQIVELADYVTDMKMIRHPYTRNISARKGIEY